MALTKVTGGGIKDGTITNDDISSTTVIGKSKLAVTPVATGSVSGLMSSTHKGKLDGIADNANNYTKPANEAISYITGLQSAINAKVSSVAGKSLITDSVLAQLLLDVTALETLVISDTSNLNTLQEIVDFIELNKATLDTLGIANIAGLQNALDAKLSLTGGTMTGALTVNGNIRSNYLRVIKTGTNNTTQLTFNAPQTTVGTDTYSPSYFGGASAGMTVIKMPSGGEGGLQFYVKKHGTTGGSHDLSTFTNAFTIKDTGNVGIGTSSPSSKLHIHYAAAAYNTVDDVLRLVSKFTSSNNAASAYAESGPAIVFAGGIGDNQTRDRARIVAPYEGGNTSGLAFHTQNTADIITEKMRIQNNGNVGIGTSSPSKLLEINKSAAGVGGELFIRNDAGTSAIGDSTILWMGRNTSTRNVQLKTTSEGWYGQDPKLEIIMDNSVTAMRIDSVGRVTMPYQPAFQVKDLYTPSIPANGTGIATAGNVDVNRGNCYNTSNGRFTAPVTGAYLFSASVQEYNSGSGNYISLSFYKNGGSTTIETVSGVGGTYNNHKQLNHTAILQLNAGDYVNMFCYRGARDYIQNYFNGHLIG